MVTIPASIVQGPQQRPFPPNAPLLQGDSVAEGPSAFLPIADTGEMTDCCSIGSDYNGQGETETDERDVSTVSSEPPREEKPRAAGKARSLRRSHSPNSVLDDLLLAEAPLSIIIIPETKRISAAPSSEPATKPEEPSHRVSFAPTVSLRVHDVIVADHPCCADGLALGLGWDHHEDTADLRTVEPTGPRRRARRRTLTERRCYLLANTDATSDHLNRLQDERKYSQQQQQQQQLPPTQQLPAYRPRFRNGRVGARKGVNEAAKDLLRLRQAALSNATGASSLF